MSDAVSVVKKPELRRLLHNQIKKNLFVGFILSVIGGIAVQYLVNEPRKARYAEFYRTSGEVPFIPHICNKGAIFCSWFGKLPYSIHGFIIDGLSNYDIDKEFNKMRNKGLFDSCEPDP